MRKGILASVLSLVSSTGLALGQAEAQTPPTAWPPTANPSPGLTWQPAPGYPRGANGTMGYSVQDPSGSGGAVQAVQTMPPGYGYFPASIAAASVDATEDDLADEPPGREYAHADAEKEKSTDKGWLCWASAEYLHWWSKDGPLPVPLVTTGSIPNMGIIGAPDTQVLFGGSPLDYGAFSGARVAAGISSPGQSCGIEVIGLYLPERDAGFQSQSDATGTPLLARPFLDVATQLPSAALITAPGVATGSIDISSSSSLWGLEVNLIRHMYSGKWVDDGPNPKATVELDCVVGGRYLNFGENLGIMQVSNVLPGGLVAFNGAPVVGPATLTVQDQFDTRNQFYGGQLGSQAEFQYGGVFVNLVSKVALGVTHQAITVNGNSALTGAAVAMPNLTGGLLALPSNIGKIANERFTWIPEGAINLGWEWKKCFRVFVGYNFLYWSTVVRPGLQVSPQVNLTQVPASLAFGTEDGPLAPLPVSRRSDCWIQGISTGFAIRY